MIIIKWTILILIITVSSFLGNTLANKYKDRVKDLKQVKTALNVLKTKITYTYEPLPQIFLQISQEFQNNIRQNIRNSKYKHERKNSRRSMERSNSKIKHKHAKRRPKYPRKSGQTTRPNKCRADKSAK